MDKNWQPPEGHPITVERARILLAGDLGYAYRDFLQASCAPLFWFRSGQENPTILSNGTLTFAQTPERVIGVTASHVVRAYERHKQEAPVHLQLMGVNIENLNVIDLSERYDLATISLDPELLGAFEKNIAPITLSRHRVPEENRGIMLAGYPCSQRLEPKAFEANFGLFTAIGIARRVTDEQITWVVERENLIDHPTIPQPPPFFDFGGISGGPLIGSFETANHIVYHELSGIISQASSRLENVIAKRVNRIRDDGTIRV